MSSSSQSSGTASTARTDYGDEHLAVLVAANKIFLDKSKVRGQMWLEWPPSDKIRELEERVMRIKAAYQGRERVYPTVVGPEQPQAAYDRVIIEDCLDVINYANFLIKQIRRGHRG
jgi:hypothetical protein